MNHIYASVTKIQSVENLTLITLKTQEQSLQMMALALDSAVIVGSKVILSVKAFNIALAKKAQTSLSISNQLPCTVKKIEKGSLLGSITLTFQERTLESLMSLEALEKMQMSVGENLIALIPESELSIVEVEAC